MSSRFGDLLLSAKALSSHDVDEVLEEQRQAGEQSRPFGQTALDLGLCTPSHVWQAWADQLTDPGNPPTVALSNIGIDVQAVAAVPKSVAIEFGILPIRLIGETIILAVSSERILAARLELPTRLQFVPRFVIADPQEIISHLEICYHRLQACA